MDLTDILKKISDCKDFNDLKNLAIQIGSLHKDRSDAQTLRNSSIARWNSLVKQFPDLSMAVINMNKHMKDLDINLDRSSYLFGWLTLATETTSLLPGDVSPREIPFKGSQYKVSDVLMYLKLKGIVFDIILDDIGDQYQGKNAKNLLTLMERILIDEIDKDTLQNLLKHSSLTTSEVLYLDFVFNLWLEYIVELKSFGDKDTYKLIIIEYLEVIIASQNKFELNRLFREKKFLKAKVLSTKIEEANGFNPTMHIVINGIIDIAYIKKEDNNVFKLNGIIKILRQLETLGRIGDDISTWKREVKEYDFTSFIARKLLLEYNVNQDDLANLNVPKELIADVLNIYTNKYVAVWKDILKIRHDLGSVKVIDLDDLFMRYLGGFSLQLFSEGYK